MVDRIQGRDWARMMDAAHRALEIKQKEIDALNVFPVPDGDTGTNMALTMKSAAAEAGKAEGGSVGEMAEAAARGALLGARGNSGVILSQFLRGLALGLKGLATAGPRDFDRSLQQAVDLIYQAVLKPVEGTMLTVARETADTSREVARKKTSFQSYMGTLATAAERSLARTPELLPVLKEAGVVDAGGKGLLEVLAGFCQALGEDCRVDAGTILPAVPVAGEPYSGKPDIGDFLYCTEFLLQGESLPAGEIKDRLEQMGDSLLVVGDGDVLKIHVHTNHPGEVLEICLAYGSLSKVAIHNMEEQAQTRTQEMQKAEQTEKPFAVVAVANGDGWQRFFDGLGADRVIAGGPTMNPSTEELLRAIEAVRENKVMILPNEKNIIPAAEQAAGLSPKEVQVIMTTSPVQGICVLTVLDRNKDVETNIKKAECAINGVTTLEITRAVRDATFNGLQVKGGDYLGLVDGQGRGAAPSPGEVAAALLPGLITSETELIMVYYGEGITRAEADKFAAGLKELAPGCDTEVHNGGQPHYQYLIGIE